MKKGFFGKFPASMQLNFRIDIDRENEIKADKRNTCEEYYKSVPRRRRTERAQKFLTLFSITMSETFKFELRRYFLGHLFDLLIFKSSKKCQ